MNHPPLKVLMLHNYYQNAGGEDTSMASEIEILRQQGHTVDLLEWHNDSIQAMSKFQKAALFWRTTWNPAAQRRVATTLQAIKADLLHVQNFFPLASPAVYDGARQLDIPVVQHLHNFRLGCLNAYLYRNHQVCEACVGHNPWQGVWYRCYRGSLPASLSLWQMLTVHRQRQTWHRKVNAFIVPSQFAANKLIEIGLPAQKMHVKPNFVADPLKGREILPLPQRPTFLYVGRLSPEKGGMTFLKAWRQLNQPEWQFIVAGGGDQLESLQQYCTDHQLTNVEFRRHLPAGEVLALMQQVTAIVVPSQWYETFGRVVIEAFACGRIALVSDLGAVGELVQDTVTGLKVVTGDIDDWVSKLKWCGEHSAQIESMGITARQEYEQHYTPAINYQRLIEIYDYALRG